MILAGLGIGTEADLHADEAKADPPDTEVVVTAPRFVQPCSRARVSGPIDYGCLNQALKTDLRRAPGAAGVADTVAAQANVPSRVGTFSFSATAQRMGSNFGKAATPYRPPPPVYANPVIAGQPPR